MGNKENGVAVEFNHEKLRLFLVGNAKNQRWLAAKLGVSLRTITNMMDGKAPRVETTERVSKLIGVPVSKLLKVL